MADIPLTLLLKVKDMASSELEKVKGGLGGINVAAVAIGGAAVAGVGLLAKGLVDCAKSGMEAELTQAKLGAVLTSTGKAADAQAAAWANAQGKMVSVKVDTKTTADELEAMKDKLVKLQASLVDQGNSWNKAKTHTESARVNLVQTKESIVELQAAIDKASATKMIPLAESLGLVAPQARMTKDAVNELATSLSKVTPFEDDLIVSAETMLLTFTNIGKDVFPRATESVLNMATMFGGADAASVQLGKALNDPIAGVGALSKVGVTFTDTQKEMIKKLVETGDMAGAQGVILKELETEFGGLARAAGETLTGKLTILNNQFSNVKEEIGLMLIPMLTSLAKAALPVVEKGIRDLLPVVKSTFDWIGDNVVPILSAIVGYVVDNWPEILATVKSVLVPMWELIQTVLEEVSAIWTQYHDEYMAILTVAWDFIKTTVDTAIKLVQGIIKLAMSLIKGDWQGAWEAVKGIAETMWGQIKNVIDTAIKLVVNILKLAGVDIEGIWNNLKAAAVSIWNAIKDGMVTPIQKAWDSLNSSMVQIEDGLVGAWNSIKASASSTWTAIKTAITSPLEAAKGVVSEIMGAIQKLLNSIQIPHIKTPHVKVSSSTTDVGGVPITIPSISVDWYGAGVDRVFSRPTLIGVGEAGAERVQVTPLGKNGGGSGTSLTYIDQRVGGGVPDLIRVARGLEWRARMGAA